MCSLSERLNILMMGCLLLCTATSECLNMWIAPSCGGSQTVYYLTASVLYVCLALIGLFAVCHYFEGWILAQFFSTQIHQALCNTRTTNNTVSLAPLSVLIFTQYPLPLTCLCVNWLHLFGVFIFLDNRQTKLYS